MRTDLLKSGIYSIPEAARLINVRPSRIRGWFQGYSQSSRAPLLSNELSRVQDKTAITFINLIEARFIKEFTKHNVSIQSIRVMAKNAQEMFGRDHPFASDVVYRTDGNDIFAVFNKTIEDTDDRKLLSLKKKNYAFYEFIESSLREGMVYAEDGLAKAWYPRKAIAPEIIIHPDYAFGQPVTVNEGVPTTALFDAFNAEDETYESVGYWFDIPSATVEQAVKFEWDLRSAT